MAKGDCTLTKRKVGHPWYGDREFYYTAVFDNYKTGGFTFDLSAIGDGTLYSVRLPNVVSGMIPMYDETNKKLLFYWVKSATTVLTEVDDNDSTLNAVSMKFSFVKSGG